MTPSGGYCGDGCDDSFVDPSSPKTQAFMTPPLGHYWSPVPSFTDVIIFCLLLLFYKLFELETIGYFRRNKDRVQVVHGFDNGAREQYHLPEGAMQRKIPKDVNVDLRFRPLPNQVGVFHVQDKNSHRNGINSGGMFLRRQGQVASNRFSSSPDPDDTPPAPLGPTDAPKWNSARTFGIQDENDSYELFGGNNYRSQSPCHQFGFDRRIAPGPMRYQTTTRPSVGTPPSLKQGVTRGQFGGNNQSQTRLYSNSRNDNNAQNTVPKPKSPFQNTSQKLRPSSFQNTSQKLRPSSFQNTSPKLRPSSFQNTTSPKFHPSSFQNTMSPKLRPSSFQNTSQILPSSSFQNTSQILPSSSFQNTSPKLRPSSFQNSSPKLRPSSFQNSSPKLRPSSFQNTSPKLRPSSFQNTSPKLRPSSFQNTSPKLRPSSFQNTSPKLPPSSFSRNNLGQLPASRAPGPRSGSNSMFGGGSQLQWQPSVYKDKKQASVSNNQRAPQIRNTWPALPLSALKYTKPSSNVIGFPIPPRAPASRDDSDWTLYAFKS